MAATSAITKIDITASIAAAMAFAQTDGGGVITAQSNPQIQKSFSFVYGSASGQALKAGIAQGVIPASSSVVIDLSTVNDFAGLPLFALSPMSSNKVKGLGLLNTSTPGSDCHFTFGPNAAANPFIGPFGADDNTVECRVSHPPLILVRLDGWADNLSSAKKLLISNPGSVQGSYQLLVIAG